MSIIMTGGGTGGHLAIIKAVKEHLKDDKLIYIGSTKGQDKQWFEKDNDFKKKYFFETRGVVNQSILGKFKSLYMIVIATVKSILVLRKHKAKVVFSVGGFSAAPMAVAAKITFTPLIIHEQNAALGSLNKLLQPYSTSFISSYLESSPIKAYPIKEIFFHNARVRNTVQTIIFLGGSQGAKAINGLALEMAPFLAQRDIKILHQAGQKNVESVQESYDELGINAEVFGFTNQLETYMAEADFAIARAGASTLWELSATALPTLYIPYPYAASNHQYYNAQFLVKQKLSWVMRENEIEIDAVLSLMAQDLTDISRGLMNIVEKDGSEKIAQLVQSYLPIPKDTKDEHGN